MLCVLNNDDKIINVINGDVPVNYNERRFYEWNLLGEKYSDTEPFGHMQERLNNELGSEFAKRRDVVRFINLPSGNRYGFDCAVEDISNFMAAYTPLLIAGSGETGYKVWKNEAEKGLVILTLADMQAAYNYVRESQLSAYAWLATSQVKINAVTEADGKEKLQAVYDECIATPTK